MAGEVALTVRTNKTTFPVTDSTQLAYVLVEAMPTGEAADVQMPLNFSLVLDHSGSMSGKKIENLKEAAKLAVDQMSPEDLVSILIFDDSVDLIAESQPVTDPEALKAQIDEIDAAGGTNISFAMRDSLEELAKGMASGRVNRMLLLTDGETYGDEDDCRRLAAEAGRQDVPVTALGLGDDWIEELLDDIAEASGGMVDFLEEDKPEMVLQTFERAVKSAQATVVQDAMLLLRLVPGVMPRAVWRVTPMITKLGHRAISERDVQVELGDMERETGQSVLVELMISPRRPGTYRLAQAEVDYNVPALGLTGEKAKSDVILTFSSDTEVVSAATADRDPYVLNIVEKVTAHKLQTRALDEAAVGDITGATQKLRAAATRLLSVGEEDLAETAMHEAERLEQGEKLSSEGTKKLRYETRKLTQKLDDASG